FFFQAEDGIRDFHVTGVQTCALPISVSAVLEITLDEELELNDYLVSLRRMYGEDTMSSVVGAVDGTIRFPGLTPTNMQLDGLDKIGRASCRERVKVRVGAVYMKSRST